MRTVFSRYFTCTILLSLLMVPSLAQVVFATKISSKKIGRNEVLEVSYEVLEGAIENFSEPRFPGWQLVGGPNVSSSTIITNGKRASSMSYQFLLRPNETGMLSIPGAKAMIDGKLYASKPVSVEVTKNGTENSAPSNAPDPLFVPPIFPPQENPYESNDALFIKEGENIATKTKNNLFVQVDVSKKTCYPGEAIKATYKLYSRVNMDAHITKRPSFNGFSSIDLPDPNNSEYETETRNGKTYKVYLIRSVQLYPLQTGIQTLQPVEIETTVQYQKFGEALQQDPFGSTPIINYPFTVKSEPISVNVIPFPDENKPADFNGVTGDFSIEASSEHSDYAKNEAGVLRVTINGSGNWAMLQQPVIKWPSSIDVFEPVVSEKLDSQAIPITGKRIYEFPFSANKAGNLVIAPVSISFFDATNKKYVTLNSKTVAIKIRNTAAPIHHAATVYQNNLPADGTIIFTRIVQVVFPLAAVLLLVWFFVGYRKKRDSAKQAEALKKASESAAMKHHVKPASRYANLLAVTNQPDEKNYYPTAKNYGSWNNGNDKFMKDNEHQEYTPLSSGEYFRQLKNNLQQLLKFYFNMDELPLNATKNTLESQGLDSETVNNIMSLLAQCEKQSYSPFNESFDQPYCDNLMQQISNTLKNRGSHAKGLD